MIESPEEVQVVAAVIEENGHFLVTRRGAGTHLAGLWEFPGGKVDAGETHAAALRREILEELGSDVAVGELVLEAVHAYPERVVRLHFYRCTLLGKPGPLLGQEMRWVARNDLRALGFPPADAQLLTLLTQSAVQ